MKTSITINPEKQIGRISPFVYGHFFEHTYDTMQGLVAERLRNRKFGLGFADQAGVPAYWEKWPADSSARFRVQCAAPIESNGRWEEYLRQFNIFRDVPWYIKGTLYSQEIFSSGETGPAGICQRGIYVKKGQDHEVSLWCQTRDGSSLSVGLVDQKGSWATRKELNLLAGKWEHYQFILEGSPDNGFYTFVILCSDKADTALFAPSLKYADHERGIRKDVLDALAEIRPSVIRYPGGCFADAHHWEVMIGPKDGRMPYFDLQWRQWEENDFGTDEFLYLCRRVGAEPFLCINFAGSVEEAGRWVEYCNGSPATPMGQLRARNGHEEPYGVKYWELGNELVNMGEIGHGSAEAYAAKSREFVASMKGVDPDITVVLNGENAFTGKWTRELISHTGGDMDAISIHHYVNTGRLDPDISGDIDGLYKICIHGADFYEELFRKNINLLNELTPNKIIPICFGEWNVWVTTEWHDQGYRIGHALFCASVFHVFHRLCRHIWMANQSTTINVQGLITSTPQGIVLSSEYRAFELYAKHFGSTALAVSVDCEESFDGIPALDVSASLSEDNKRLFLAVVNRHPTEDISAGIDSGEPKARLIAVHELNSSALEDRNTEEDNRKIDIHHHDFSGKRQPKHYRFPAHSISIFEWLR